ncbi:hypothetical protein [Alienimonas sp. DA493]|uniref:hypothetical protein n=1 Tax=Alienimonas sp. DA493 TaxID=3373605 RepID=UPI003754E6AD
MSEPLPDPPPVARPGQGVRRPPSMSWRDFFLTFGVALLVVWAVAGVGVAVTEGRPIHVGLIWAALVPLWLLAVVGSLTVAGLGGAICAAAGFAAVRAGRRGAGGAFALLAVLHGLAWQTGVLLNWRPAKAPELLAVGGLAALPLLAGLGLLAWIARGGGLSVDPEAPFARPADRDCGPPLTTPSAASRRRRSASAG